MQISKKLYATLIIALLTISVLTAAIPMVAAEITADPILDVNSGAVGTTVNVSGLAGAAAPFSTVNVFWDALAGIKLGSTSASNTGSYAVNVKIPASVAGDHYIIVNDGESETGGSVFTVTGQLIIKTIPPTIGTPKALPGDQLSVAGHGFAADSVVTLTFLSTTLGTPVTFGITTPVITSNATGSFSATITLPSTLTIADFDIYDVTAEDEDTNTAVAQVNINYYVLCVPPAGPVGITTTISGRIAPNVAFIVRFNGAQIGSGTSAADGSYTTAYTIPGVLSTGPYTVDVVWATVNTRSTTFTINPSPVIALGVGTGIAGDIVTITGSGFSAGADVTLYFGTTAVNSTATGFGPTTVTPVAGNLPAGLTFVVPTLTPSIYSVTVVDQYGATSAVVYFTINPTPVFMAETRATQYMRMDFLSIKSLSTSPTDVILRIVDPMGLIWYQEAVTAGEWQMISGAYQIPYDTLDLTWWPITSDAPLGTWNFTCWNSGATQILDTNMFTVIAKPNQQDVLDALDDLEGTITGLMTTSEGKIIASINTKTGTIMTDLSALKPKIQGIEDTVIIIATMLGEVQVDIADLDMSALSTLGAEITAIKNDIATVKTNIGTVSTKVSNLDPVVGAIAGQLVEVQTKLGTLEGKITSIDGKTATIETKVGTLQADLTSDIADIPSKVDMMPVWIAVVLSLIAAIAAIFAVITIRQKIAG
jgi:hypothetical protein